MAWLCFSLLCVGLPAAAQESAAERTESEPESSEKATPEARTAEPGVQAVAEHERGSLHVLVFVGTDPVAGAEVSVSRAEGTTNAYGFVHLEPPSGERSLRLRVPKHALADVQGSGTYLVQTLPVVQIVPGETVEVILTLTPQGTIESTDIEGVADAAHQPDVGEKLETARTEKASGTLQGTVVSAESGDPVAGARVFVRGAPVEAESGADGQFTLELPEGIYALSVIHSDFSTETIEDIQVEADGLNVIQVEMVPAAVTLEEFIVTAPHLKGGVAGLIAERRETSAVTDAIGSEAIARSPDSNASGAARRIVGASVVGGQFLVVRGLGGRYSNVRLNGVPLPSTDPNLPGFQIDLFPASLLSSLTIAKTFTPEIPGSFAGGSMNVKTRDFPERLQLGASIGLSANTESTGHDTLTYAGGDYDFLGFDDGTRAIPGAVPDSALRLRSITDPEGLSPEELNEIGRAFPNTWATDRQVALPNLSLGLTAGDTTDLDGHKLGYLLTAGYKLKSRRYLETLTRVNVSRVEGELVPEVRQQLERETGVREAQLGTLGTVSYELSKGSRVSLVSLLTQTGTDETSLVTGFAENEGAFWRQSRLQFVSRTMFFNQVLGEHEELIGPLSLSWQLNGALVRRSQPDTRDIIYTRTPGTEDFLYRDVTGSGQRLYTNLGQQGFGGGLDLSVPIFEGEAAVGYMGQVHFRNFQARRFGFQATGSLDRSLPPEELFADENLGNGLRLQERTNDTDGYDARQELHATYAMADVPVSSWLRVAGGARLEAFTQLIEADPPIEASGTPPPDTERTDLDVLPSASLVFSLTEEMNLRAAYGGTVGRPLVSELARFLNQDFVQRRIIQGNPDLKRTYIHNFDLRWEMFPAPTEVLAASVFVKRFQDPIELVILDTQGNIQYQNAASAQNYGLELEARLQLDRIAEWLHGFQLFANLSLIQSKVTLTEEQQMKATTRSRPLQGQSPYVANVSVGYQTEESPVSVFVFYNVFGSRITDVGLQGVPNIYERPFHSLDVTAFWRIDEQWTLSTSVENILLDDVLREQGGFPFSKYEKGLTASAKMSWRY